MIVVSVESDSSAETVLMVNPMRMHGINSLCKSRIIGKNAEMTSFMTLFSEIPNRPSNIVCVGVKGTYLDVLTDNAYFVKTDQFYLWLRAAGR